MKPRTPHPMVKAFGDAFAGLAYFFPARTQWTDPGNDRHTNHVGGILFSYLPG